MRKSKKLPAKLQVWVDARERFKLSDAHIQMAREIGLNPKKFGSLANHNQEPWKESLTEFIENLYFERFGQRRPDEVLSIEEVKRKQDRKKAERRARKLEQKNEEEKDVGVTSSIKAIESVSQPYHR